jgi:hypothetical protein
MPCAKPRASSGNLFAPKRTSTRSRQDYELFVGNLGEARRIEAQVRLDHLRRQPPQPLVKGDVLENVRGEHLQEDRVGVPRVLDIMRGVGGYIADVIWVKVNRAGVVTSPNFWVDPKNGVSYQINGQVSQY